MYCRRPSVADTIGTAAVSVVDSLFYAAWVAAAAQREENARLAAEWNAYNHEVARREAVMREVDYEIADIRLRDIARRAEHRIAKRRLASGG